MRKYFRVSAFEAAEMQVFGGKIMDRYTKIVLTVIALALVAIAGESGIGAASAQQEIHLAYGDACGTATHPICQVQIVK